MALPRLHTSVAADPHVHACNVRAGKSRLQQAGLHGFTACWPVFAVSLPLVAIRIMLR